MALDELSVYSQRQSDLAAKEKTKKIINSELMKVAGSAAGPQGLSPHALNQPALLGTSSGEDTPGGGATSDDEMVEVRIDDDNEDEEDDEETHSDIEVSSNNRITRGVESLSTTLDVLRSPCSSRSHRHRNRHLQPHLPTPSTRTPPCAHSRAALPLRRVRAGSSEWAKRVTAPLHCSRPSCASTSERALLWRSS